MQKIIQHSVIALLIAIAFLLPQADHAQAASWHAPLGWRWTIDRICRNGVKVTMRLEPSDNPKVKGTLVVTYIAKRAIVRNAPSQPQKLTEPPALGHQYGSITITAKSRRIPLSWVDDEHGKAGIAYVYGIGNLKWRPDLPVGIPIAVKWDEQKYTASFLGSVTNCKLP